MRTVSVVTSNAKTQAEHLRVRVYDGAAWRDLTTYPGYQALKSVQWADRVGDATGSATVKVVRELGKLSLSPWMADSALNRGFDPSGAYEPLLQLNRLFVIEVEITPADRPASGLWVEYFRGRIDTIDPAQGDFVAFSGRDLAGRLAMQQIKYERVYSLADDGGLVSLREWKPNTVFSAGDYCLPAKRGVNQGVQDPGYGKFYVLTAGGGGASGLTEPTWTGGGGIGDGALTWAFAGLLDTSGHAVESVIQNILDDNVQQGDSTVALWVPASPGWFVKEYQQTRTFTLDAIRTLAAQCGGDVRMKWDSGTGAFRLALWFPERSVATPQHTFGADEYLEPTAMPIDIATIRNSWRGIYTDPSNVLSDGKSLGRKQVDVSDATSIAKYGELWAEIQEDASSQIDTEAEMTAMLNAAKSDCAEPTTQFTVRLVRGFPYVELGDFYAFSADGIRFSSAFNLAVTGYSHIYEKGHLSTQLELRGKPSIGADRWITMTVGLFIPALVLAGQNQTQSFSGAEGLALSSSTIIGGNRITIAQQIDKRSREWFYEHHVYGTAGTALSSSTLLTVSRDRTVEFSHLTPGQTYYHRAVPRCMDGGRLIVGTPTEEKSLTPGYVEPMHLNPEKFRGETPPNGSFEGFSTASGTGAPPDHWEMVSSTWGTHVAAGPVKGVPAVEGQRYLRWLGTASFGAMQSRMFPVSADNIHTLNAKIYRVSGDGNVAIGVQWYDGDKVAIGGLASLVVALSGLTASQWYSLSKTFLAPTNAAFARAAVTRATSNSDQFYLDAFAIENVGEPWREVGASGQPAFTHSWVNYGGNYATCAFRKDRWGRVHLKGLVKLGSIGAPVFTLPDGYRIHQYAASAKYLYVPSVSNNAFGVVEVQTGGGVVPQVGNNAFFTLDGMHFEIF